MHFLGNGKMKRRTHYGKYFNIYVYILYIHFFEVASSAYSAENDYNGENVRRAQHRHN